MDKNILSCQSFDVQPGGCDARGGHHADATESDIRPGSPLCSSQGPFGSFSVVADHEPETSYISHISNPGPNMKRTAAPEPPKPDHTEPGRREVQGRWSFSWP